MRVLFLLFPAALFMTALQSTWDLMTRLGAGLFLIRAGGVSSSCLVDKTRKGSFFPLFSGTYGCCPGPFSRDVSGSTTEDRGSPKSTLGKVEGGEEESGIAGNCSSKKRDFLPLSFCILE